MQCIDLPQDRETWNAVAKTTKNLWFPLNAPKFLTNWGTTSFSRNTLFNVVSLLRANRRWAVASWHDAINAVQIIQTASIRLWLQWICSRVKNSFSKWELQQEQQILKFNFHHHHHLALQPIVSLGLPCYSPPLVSILSFPSPSFNPHLS